jgi:hypothetical protein
MRLLSFITEIERALIAESPVVEGGAWNSLRLVNFQQQLARVTLTANPAAELPITGGSVLLQCFSLADGSICLKANLSWSGSESMTTIAVYDTPGLNWRLEASRIATAFLEGPREIASTTTLGMSETSLAPLVAVAS